MSRDDPPLLAATVTLRAPEFVDRELVLPVQVTGEWNLGDRHGRLSADERLTLSVDDLGVVRDWVRPALADGERSDADGDADDPDGGSPGR